MAKKTCTFSLDETTIKALDDASKNLGMSRSMIVNQVLGATLGEASTADVVQTMFSAAMSKKKSGKNEKADWYPVFD